MCIVFFAYRVFCSCPFLLLDNRDEYLKRPTKPLHQWEDFPSIIASRDLERKGTWMAVNKELKRFAVLTNLREPFQKIANQKLKSRGQAVLKVITDTIPLHEALEKLNKERFLYGAFNLIVGDLSNWNIGEEKIWYFGSYIKEDLSSLQLLKAGNIYGLSNASLNTPWPKLTKGISLVNKLDEDSVTDVEESFKILRNSEKVSRDLLKSTLLASMEHEYQASSIFVSYNDIEYGTRTSSVLMIKKDDPTVYYYERTYDSLNTDCYNDIEIPVPLN